VVGAIVEHLLELIIQPQGFRDPHNPKAVTFCVRLRMSFIFSNVTSASCLGEPPLDIVPEHIGISKSRDRRRE